MRNENLQKMSALADRTIAVTSGILNYFAFQEALENMTENPSVTCCVHQNGEKTYFVTEKGTDTARHLQHMAGKSYRKPLQRLYRRSFE